MNLKTLLILSIALNILLGAYSFRPSPDPDESGKEPARAENRSAPKPTSGSLDSTTVTNTVVKQMNWERVESADYRKYIENLRSVGCPEETIRDIILADVNKLYDAKKKEVKGGQQKFEFWKGGNAWMGSVDAETLKKLQALDQEKNQVLRALGIEPDFKMQAASLMNPFETMMDFLPDEKKAKMMKLFSDMQTEMAALQKDGAPEMADILKVQKNMENAAKALLTPEEFRAYDLRFSMTANTMRSQVSGWDPDEEEFLKVYDLRKAFDENYSPLARADETDAQRKAREAAEKDLKATLKAELGEDRFQAYERAQDYNFQQTLRAAKQADLGSTEAIAVYDMKKMAEEQARSVRNNKDLTGPQRKAALEGIRQETEIAIQDVLKEKGWQHYNKRQNTYWLKNISPDPKAADAPKEISP